MTSAETSGSGAVRSVRAAVNYLAPMTARPRYHANDQRRDNLVLDPRTVRIEDLRGTPTALDIEGFALLPHQSAVADLRDEAEVARLCTPEVERLLLAATGADRVVVTGKGILRFEVG